jgi:tetratricopeptide (TPR) repeat protein
MRSAVSSCKLFILLTFSGGIPMRTTLIRGVLAFLVLVAVSVAPALAQSQIRGKVLDAQGKPVEGATVTFEQQGTSAKRDTKTDRKGEFMQIGLPSGTWKVTAAKEGVGTATTTGQLTMSRPVDLQLTLAAAAAGGLAGAAPADAKAAAELKANADAAAAALQAGKYDEAVVQLQSLVTKVPTCGDCYTSMGNAYAAQKQYTEAEAAYKKAVEIKPSGDAYSGLMKIYNDQKKFDLAAEASANAAKYGAAGAAGGGNAEGAYNQGVVLFNAGKFAEAKAQFEAATKADPNMALAHYYLGMASLNTGDIPMAATALETYLKVAPDGDKAAEVKQSLPAIQAMVKK